MITLKLNKDEAQQVLDALVKEPYVEVFRLVNKIQAQSAEQIENKEDLE